MSQMGFPRKAQRVTSVSSFLPFFLPVSSSLPGEHLGDKRTSGFVQLYYLGRMDMGFREYSSLGNTGPREKYAEWRRERPLVQRNLATGESLSNTALHQPTTWFCGSPGQRAVSHDNRVFQLTQPDWPPLLTSVSPASGSMCGT